MKKALTLAALLLVPVALAACNTISGAGKDIEAGGEVITDTAEEVQEDIKED